MIVAELQNYANTRHGPGAWTTLLQKANLTGRVYLANLDYPDADAISLMMAASAMTGLPVSAVLEDFGQFIVPAIMATYGHLLQPQWTALDVIENTEATVHSVVRVRNPGATPPKLSTRRVSPNEVLLVYTSPRRMCGLAIGIATGIGQHFHETIVATQTMCMHKGATHCEIVFRVE